MTINTHLLAALTVSAAISLSACSSSRDEETATSNTDSSVAIEALADTFRPAEYDTDAGNIPNLAALPEDVPAAPAIDLRNTYESILLDLAGYRLETLGEEIALMATGITASTPGIILPAGVIELEYQSVVQSYPVSRTQFDCSLGGSLVVDSLEVDVSFPDYSSNTSRVSYRFDQCQLDSPTPESVNGVMHMHSRNESGRRYNHSTMSYSWQGFDWHYSDNKALRVNALIDIVNTSSYDNFDTRSVQIDEFVSSLEGSVVSGLQNTLFVLRNNTIAGSGLYEYSLETRGELIDASGARITVQTDPVLYRQYAVPSFNEEGVAFNGQISFTASDGSALNLVAVESRDTRAQHVDVEFTDSSGNVSVMRTQNFIELDLFAS